MANKKKILKVRASWGKKKKVARLARMRRKTKSETHGCRPHSRGATICVPWATKGSKKRKKRRGRDKRKQGLASKIVAESSRKTGTPRVKCLRALISKGT